MSLLSYGVYLINGLYGIQSAALYFLETVYEGYREKRWVFAERNAYPVMLSSIWRTEPLMITYDPATFTFGQGIADKQSLDIVTAELKTPSTTYDLSSFLYSVKWYLAAPSLYELVLLYLLHEKTCLSTDMLDSYTLHVLTSDAEEVVIDLHSPLAKQSFRGFTEATTEGLTKGTTEGLKVD